MARKRNYNRGMRGELYRLLMTNGVLSYNGLAMLKEHKRDMYIRILRKMEKEKFVKIKWMPTGRRKVAVVNGRTQECSDQTVLTEKINDYLREIEGDIYDAEIYREYFVKFGAKKRSDIGSKTVISKSEKAYRSSEVFMMMYGANVLCLPADKPMIVPLKCSDGFAAVSPGEYEHTSIFYTDSEIKEATDYEVFIGIDETRNSIILNTRCQGALVNGRRYYMVYHTGNELLTWVSTAEQKMMHETAKIIFTSDNAVTPSSEAIIIGYTDEIFERILKEPVVRTSNKTHISISNRFRKMYAVPYNEYGQKIIEAMENNEWDKYIREKYLAGYNQYTQACGVICDGYKEKSGITEYILLFAVPDLNILGKFMIAARRQQKKDCFRIICYEYQYGIIRNICRDICTVELITNEELETDVKEILGKIG